MYFHHGLLEQLAVYGEHMSVHNIGCVFLDLGKVLLDYEFSRFADRMLSLADVDMEELRRVLSSDSLARRFETGRTRESEFYREVCTDLDVEITEEDFRDAWNSIFIDTPLLSEGIVASLARRMPLWAISNTNPIHFKYIREHFPILGNFTGFTLSFSAGSRKPEEEIFLRALNDAKVEASEALFVDDQMANVEAAQKLGLDAFRFLNADQFASELRERALL